MGKGATVLVADAFPLYSEALSMALGGHDGFWCLNDRPSNGPEAIASIEKHRPDIAIIDYFLPDMDGPTVVRSVNSVAAGCKVLLLSWLSSRDIIRQALEAGATGFLLKDCSVAELVEAVERAVAGDDLVLPDVLARQQDLLEWRLTAHLDERAAFSNLTPREIKVLSLLNSGLSTREIAAKVFITVGTARNHISSILAKTGTRSQIEAVTRARACGFLKG
ncbi:MAG: response regulator [Actinomycetota bacterium]